MPDVCFVSLRAYPVANPSESGAIGGMEMRSWTLAAALAKQPDFRVRFVVSHPRAPRREERNGVEILRRGGWMDALRTQVAESVDLYHGPPFIRIRGWRWRLLWQLPWLLMVRCVTPRQGAATKPDQFFMDVPSRILLPFGVNSVAATVVASARASSGKQSALFIASDSDLDPRYQPGSTYVNPNGEVGDVCHFAIANADVIIAQTETQQRLLRERFGRTSTLLPNPIDLERWLPVPAVMSPFPDVPAGYVLWVGRADTFHKRPLLCVEIARQCPAVRFVLVMNPRDKSIEDEVRRLAPANITIVSRVPPGDMPRAFAAAGVFLSTGSAEFEGFPNTFLQAAACEVPIVSLEAAGAFLEASHGGMFAAGDLSVAAQAIRDLRGNADRRARLGRAGRAYVVQRHAAEQVALRLAEQLRQLRTDGQA